MQKDSETFRKTNLGLFKVKILLAFWESRYQQLRRAVQNDWRFLWAPDFVPALRPCNRTLSVIPAAPKSKTSQVELHESQRLCPLHLSPLLHNAFDNKESWAKSCRPDRAHMPSQLLYWHSDLLQSMEKDKLHMLITLLLMRRNGMSHNDHSNNQSTPCKNLKVRNAVKRITVF